MVFMRKKVLGDPITILSVIFHTYVKCLGGNVQIVDEHKKYYV